jgi:hypothetical protein
MSGSSVNGSIDTPDTTVASVVSAQALPKEIVVTVGDSPAALDQAVEQSRRTGVRLRIVHAWQMTAVPSGQADTSFWVASAADARARATRWVLDALGDGAASVLWTLDIVELPADPIDPLSAHAADAALELSAQPGGSS